MDHNSYSFYSQYDENENSCELENRYETENEVDLNETDGDALLISLVRDHPYLYNKELNDFRDIIKKQNAWTEIGIILNMTGDECQSRWIRLRERYTREKKQRQRETTTGSGASKRKSFEFFENMTFLEPFVKRRRTLSNVHTKNVLPSKKFSNLQKNFDSRGGKNSSSMIASTSCQQSPNDNVERDSERNLYCRNFDSRGGKNSSSMIASTSCQQSPSDNVERDSERNLYCRNFESRGGKNSSSMIASTSCQQSPNDNVERDSEKNLYCRNFDSRGGKNSSSMIASTSCQQSPSDNVERDSERNILKIGSNNRQQMNIFPTSIPVEQSFTNETNPTHLKNSSTLSASNYIEKNKLSGQRKLKKNSSDIENAICKVTSLLENRYNSSSIASSSSSLSSLKPEATEDISFCQLVLSSLTNMPEDKNREKKKQILRIIFDM